MFGSDCVSVASGTQHAKQMRCNGLSFVACPALPFCSTLSHEQLDFQKKIIEYEMLSRFV